MSYNWLTAMQCLNMEQLLHTIACRSELRTATARGLVRAEHERAWMDFATKHQLPLHVFRLGGNNNKCCRASMFQDVIFDNRCLHGLTASLYLLPYGDPHEIAVQQNVSAWDSCACQNKTG